MNMEIIFGTNLQALRKEKKLKQSELGEKLNMTQRKISYLENGKAEPSLADLWKISDFFDVSVDFLIGKKPY